MGDRLSDETAILTDACRHLTAGDPDAAAETLNRDYPFVVARNAGRNYTPRQMTAVFLRDGFIDRYSGRRLVFPPVLRVLSAELPEAFPFHPNWKMSETHVAYWDLFPTIDHVEPVARGGADIEANWVTTSMARNAAKGNSVLSQIGWRLHPPGDLAEWDGLTSWLLDYLEVHPEYRKGYVRTWAQALEAHV